MVYFLFLLPWHIMWLSVYITRVCGLFMGAKRLCEYAAFGDLLPSWQLSKFVMPQVVSRTKKYLDSDLGDTTNIADEQMLKLV